MVFAKFAFCCNIVRHGNYVFDVAIIGAGPAGIFSSLYLSENNKDLKVVLIDKKTT